MIEFRFKIDNINTISALNKYMPAGKIWRCDKYTGEWWIKIKTDENTQRFNDLIVFFLDINSASHTLKIKDCSKRTTMQHNGITRPTLI